MTTPAATIADLEAQLNAAIAEKDQNDVLIETLSVTLIASQLREHVPTARYLHLDWSSQGPHHELDDVTDDAGVSVLGDVDVSAPDVEILTTNLRGAIADRFEAINADGGVYRVDVSGF